MIEAGLFAARLVHFVAVCALFGLSLHPFHAGAGQAGVGKPDSLLRLRTQMAVAALVGGVLWLVFTASAMSANLASGFDPDILTMVVSDTSFGQVWAGRLALSAVLIWLVRAEEPKSGWVLIGSALLAGSIALTGHGGMGETMLGPIHRVADAIHLLAAGAWVGGLAGLWRLLSDVRAGPELGAALKRFSTMGYMAVAALVATGIVNAWILVGSVGALFATVYGQLLLLKIALFIGMLGLAAMNRFRWTAAVSRRGEDGGLASLKRSVLVEQGLAVAVLAVVSVLGILAPAAG